MPPITLHPLKSALINPGDDLIPHIQKALKKAKLKLQEKDILVISSKVVSVSENQIANLENYHPSKQAEKLAKVTQLDPRFAQAVIEEADTIIGSCPGAILTLNQGCLIANAGIDQSNIQKGKIVLWPKDPKKSAIQIHSQLKTQNSKLGIIISDSRCLPLRQGTVGFSLAHASFEAVIDERGNKDLFGNEYRITKRNMADSLAVAANMLMGDTTEQTPFVLIRGVDVKFTKTPKENIVMNKKECLFRDMFKKSK